MRNEYALSHADLHIARVCLDSIPPRRSTKPPPTDQAPPTTYLKNNRLPAKGTTDLKNHRSIAVKKTDHRPDYGC